MFLLYTANIRLIVRIHYIPIIHPAGVLLLHTRSLALHYIIRIKTVGNSISEGNGEKKKINKNMSLDSFIMYTYILKY